MVSSFVSLMLLDSDPAFIVYMDNVKAVNNLLVKELDRGLELK